MERGETLPLEYNDLMRTIYVTIGINLTFIPSYDTKRKRRQDYSSLRI